MITPVAKNLKVEQGAALSHPEQLPLALVYGEAMTALPLDLYIPPDALEVILEAFAGPLDLLLYLIRKDNIDILDIQVAQITHQYMAYVELMKAMHLELAAEYLVMAAMLAEIKSRMLLPRSKHSMIDDEDDPRAELIRRLQDYERIKAVAEDLDDLPRLERDIFIAQALAPVIKVRRLNAEVALEEVLLAMADVLRRADMFESHHISRETLSTRERMSRVLEALRGGEFVPFSHLFSLEEGRSGVVVTFIAVLELVKESLIELIQNSACSEIHIRARIDE